jgi:hypothetical protein
MNCKKVLTALIAVALVFHLAPAGAAAAELKPNADASWGKSVDGLACRLLMEPRYVAGQVLWAVMEVKNVSNKRRYIVPQFDPRSIEITGPDGRLEPWQHARGPDTGNQRHEAIEPGEVKRYKVPDLGYYFVELNTSLPYLKPGEVPKATGKYTARFRFYSPEAPPRFLVTWTVKDGYKYTPNRDFSAEITAGQWVNEAVSASVSFELALLGRDDLVVHEWGVFTVFNDVKYANVNRAEEWGSLPRFFYRQFPKERLRWVPSAWDKPIV